MYREQELVVYLTCDAWMCTQVPSLLVHWVKIRISNSMEHQLRYTDGVPFPDLGLLCDKLDNK